jgi:ureidoacrylate peracid hydrolase
MASLGPTRANRWNVSAEHVDLRRPSRDPRPVTVAAMPQALTLDLTRAAIIVIDMQNDFCTPGGWLDHIGVDVTPTHRAMAGLAPLLPRLRAVGVPVLWVNWGNRPDRLNLSPALLHVYNPTGDGVGLGDPLPANGARVLEKSAWGAAIVDELSTDAADIHVDKYRMSGFWDTPLDSILRNLRVDTLLFGGVNADQCVMATLQDANFLGYDTIMLEDCSATTSPDYCWQATIYNVRQCFGFTMIGADLARAIDSDGIGAAA